MQRHKKLNKDVTSLVVNRAFESFYDFSSTTILDWHNNAFHVLLIYC